MKQRHCPVCERPSVQKEWQDDVAGAPVTTERLFRCEACQYEEHDSYGLYSVTLGSQRWGWTYRDDEAIVSAIQQEIDLVIAFRRGVGQPC